MLELRNELELILGVKLDNVPNEFIIMWMDWIKHPFPEHKSDVIYGLRKAVHLNQMPTRITDLMPGYADAIFILDRYR